MNDDLNVVDEVRTVLQTLLSNDMSVLDTLNPDEDSVWGDLAQLGGELREQRKIQQDRARGLQTLIDNTVNIAEGNFELDGFFDAQDDLLSALNVSMQMMAEELAIGQNELQMARDEAIEANSAKSHFLANMSHEVRTPLNSIIGYAELLQEELMEEGLTIFEGDLQKILTAAKHLLSLISDILDISKIEAGHVELFIESFDVSVFVQELIHTMTPLITSQGNVFEIDVAPDLGMVCTDRMRANQILLNLLSNANKFTQKGVIRFKAWRVASGGDKSDDQVHFSIQDDGVGIAQERIDAIFEPFVQEDSSTTRRFGGTGLGLAISRRLAQKLGGDIQVKSILGEGATFTLNISVYAGEESVIPSLSVGAIMPKGAAKRVDRVIEVMLVDDDPEVYELMDRTLPDKFIHITPFAHGMMALDHLRYTKILPDLIILDIHLPGVDGWGVLARLKKDAACRDIPVVIVSVEDNQSLGFALGAADYMVKPVNYSHLLSMILVLTQAQNKTNTQTILVVDDDDSARELASRALEAHGFSVMEAKDGQEALDLLKEVQPAAILLDLMMPRVDGFQLIESLKAHPPWSDIPVVVMSAMDLSEEVFARLDGTNVLSKANFSYSSLMAALTQAMHTKNL